MRARLRIEMAAVATVATVALLAYAVQKVLQKVLF